MEGVYIRWTIDNMITVVLMAAAGYLLFALLAQLFLSKSSSKPALRVVA